MIPHFNAVDAATLRASAAQALAVIGADSEPAIPALAAALHDPDRQVCWTAATALGKIGYSSIPALAKALRSNDTTVCHAAIYALGEAGAAMEIVPIVMPSLLDLNHDVRASATDTLCKANPKLMPIIKMVGECEGTPWEANVRSFLAEYSTTKKAQKSLAHMVADNCAREQCGAIQAIALLCSNEVEARNVIIGAFHDTSSEVRLAAIKAVAYMKLSDDSTVSALMSCLKDPYDPVREAAARALGKIGPPACAAIPALVETSKTDSEPARAADVQAIGFIKPTFTAQSHLLHE
jgi:hypothetical protein